MKKSPTKRKAKTPSKSKEHPRIIELPSTNIEMENFIDKHRKTMFESLANVIGYGVENNLAGVEVFLFDKSNYRVVIARKDFRDNLDNIFNSSLESENYELCGKVKSIIKQLSAPTFTKEQVSTKIIKYVK